ncbi:STAS domain-containing protein [Streptomyces sp. NPDC012623]|uniref:STAS domain-containing protein n=1 Tax=unclassified Streptomyces TaxID=2593676 RepID=UPI0036A2C9CB
MSDLHITTHATPAGPALALRGELDHHSAPLLREAIDRVTLHADEQMVLDLSGLTFCDSSGITAFIVARNRTLESGAAIALAGTPPHILRVLRIVGLDQIFPLHPDTGTAAAVWAQTRNPVGP